MTRHFIIYFRGAKVQFDENDLPDKQAQLNFGIYVQGEKFRGYFIENLSWI